jgi:hypothetical protein
MVNAFSFCLYGSFNPKYYIGLKENIEIIFEKYPSFNIFIICGNDIDKDKFSELLGSYINFSNKINVLEVNLTGPLLMLLRYLPLDQPNIDCLFSRDTDSRIGERDIWCINRFLNSPFLIHTIRDHNGHFSEMMGGLSAIKKELLKKTGPIKNILPLNKNAEYNYDQYILNNLFYAQFRDLLLVHSTKNIFNDPFFEEIPLPVNKENFCGQVIDYDINLNKKFVYEYIQ